MTCREIITRALRRLGIVGIGNAPTADQAVSGLAYLQELYVDLINHGKDGVLTGVLITEDYEAGEDERVAYSGVGSVTVTCPATITENNVERQPNDLAAVLVAGEPSQTFLYDAQIGDWVQIESLALADEAPLSGHYGPVLGALLAVSMADEFGFPIPAMTAAMAQAGRQRIVGRMQPQSLFFSPDFTRC